VGRWAWLLYLVGYYNCPDLLGAAPARQWLTLALCCCGLSQVYSSLTTGTSELVGEAIWTWRITACILGLEKAINGCRVSVRERYPGQLREGLWQISGRGSCILDS
jgi:hypothetical protein